MEAILKGKNRSNDEERWLKALGNHIRQLIETKGYKSPYEFWVNNIGDQISRTTLNYILTGAVDVKATTLRKIARALGVNPKDILAF